MKLLFNCSQKENKVGVHRRQDWGRIPVLSLVGPVSISTCGPKSSGKGPEFEIRSASH